jgi:hypothetical protein
MPILKTIEQVNNFIDKYGIQYFRAEEFVCPCCGKILLDTDLIMKLEDLRHMLGEPIVILSAYRCPKHNKEVGGVPNSAHTKGMAVDIKCVNSNYRYKVLNINFYNQIGFNRIGIGKDFIHLDVDKSKPQNVIWHYYSKE